MSEHRGKFASIAERRLAAYIEGKKKARLKKADGGRESSVVPQKKLTKKQKNDESRRVAAALLAMITGKSHERAPAVKAESKQIRIDEKRCISCGDVFDIKPNGYCNECWIEITTGKIPSIGVSERQIASMQCRIVRKGHEMS
jgi:uncharacterized Fe-S center protein